MTGSAFVGPDLRSQRAFSSFLPTKEQPDNQQEALDVTQGDTYLVSHSSFFLIIFLNQEVINFTKKRGIKLSKSPLFGDPNYLLVLLMQFEVFKNKIIAFIILK